METIASVGDGLVDNGEATGIRHVGLGGLPDQEAALLFQLG